MIYRLQYYEYDDYSRKEFSHTENKTQEEFINDCNFLIKEYMQSEVEHTEPDGSIYIAKAFPSEFDVIEYVAENIHRLGYEPAKCYIIEYDISCDMFGCAMKSFNESAIKRIKKVFPEDIADLIIKRGKEIYEEDKKNND